MRVNFVAKVPERGLREAQKDEMERDPVQGRELEDPRPAKKGTVMHIQNEGIHSRGSPS